MEKEEKTKLPSADVILERLSNLKDDVTAIKILLEKKYVTDDQLNLKLAPLEANAKNNKYAWGLLIAETLALVYFLIRYIITSGGGK